MRLSQRMMLNRGAVAARRREPKSSRNVKIGFDHSHSGVESVLELQRTHGKSFVQRLVQRKLISDFVGNLVPQPPAGAGTKGRPIDPRENRP